MSGFKIGDLIIGFDDYCYNNSIWKISKEYKSSFILECVKENKYYKTGWLKTYLKTRICEKFKLFEIVPTEKILKNWI